MVESFISQMGTNTHKILQDRILFIYNAFFENQRKNVRAVLKLIPFQKNV